MTTFEWNPLVFPDAALALRQVYAFVRFPDGTFLVQTDRGRPNLPGGKPEVFDADVIATLRRDCLEESQVRVCGERLLGFVGVDDGEGPYAQVRYLAEVAQEFPSAPDPATGRIYERLHVPLGSLAETLAWGAHGNAQVRTLTDLIGR